MKKNKPEQLNYSDTVYLIEALIHYLGQKEGRVGTYKLELLCKLERNKRILYEAADDRPQMGECNNDANGKN
jgi:hypothetical protein